MSLPTIFLFFLLTLTTAAHAVGKPFDQAEFDRARKDGGPVLLMVHADWCPTCRAQAPVIERLSARPEFSGFRIFRLDFDKQKGFASSFRVSRQSALIVFKGGKEVGRSLGETNEDAIAALLRKGL
jgi:thioredoxin 1